jgi:hypothetical protein
MSDRDDSRTEDETDVPEDLEVREGDAAKVVGGKPAKADGALDAGVHFKYDLKAQKEA